MKNNITIKSKTNTTIDKTTKSTKAITRTHHHSKILVQPNSLNYFPCFQIARNKGGIIVLRSPDPNKFRLRRAKIIITRVLIHPTARRRRKILRFCTCSKRSSPFRKTISYVPAKSIVFCANIFGSFVKCITDTGNLLCYNIIPISNKRGFSELSWYPPNVFQMFSANVKVFLRYR